MVSQTTNPSQAKQPGKGLSEGYGVLKCRALKGIAEPEDKTSPHYIIIATDAQAQGKKYRVTINVKSRLNPPDLLVLIDNNFKHPITDKLINRNFGFTEIKKEDQKAGEIALDYIRGNLLDVNQMKPVKANVKSPENEINDINDMIDLLVQQAIKSTEIDLYVFGEPFPKDDPTGIHNIHMNQGSSGEFGKENGVFQDGALFFHFRDRNNWVAFFSAFQSQSFHTDDVTGDPIDKEGKPIPPEDGTQPPTIAADVKIIAALVNPIGNDKGEEFVVLINTTPNVIKLNGWSLKDRVKRELLLNGVIQPGSMMTVTFPGRGNEEFQLGNNGGIITLLNAQKLKVHGVCYTQEDVKQQGHTIVF